MTLSMAVTAAGDQHAAVGPELQRRVVGIVAAARRLAVAAVADADERRTVVAVTAWHSG